jgi:hypothetical protein
MHSYFLISWTSWYFQVKNIIYHAVKDAVSVLRQHEIASQTEEAGNENV